MTTPDGFANMAGREAADRAKYEAIRKTVSQSQAENIAALARDNPTLSPGLLYSAGRAGIAPGSPAILAAGEADQKKKAESGGWSLGKLVTGAYRGAKALGGALTPDIVGESLNAAAPGIKGASRGVFGLASALPEAVQSQFREMTSDGDLSVSDFFDTSTAGSKNLKNTSMGQLVKQIMEDKGRDGGLKGLDTGSGFFLGGQVAEDQKNIARTQAPLINGRATTVGRYFANTVVEPGTMQYNLLSGLVDATIAVGADPTSFASAPTKALQARRLLSGDASKKFTSNADEILEKAGVIKGVRRTVNNDRALEWLTTSAEGQRVVSYLAAETNMANLLKNTKGRIDPKLMVQLLDVKPDETTKVIEILGPALGKSQKLGEKFGVSAMGLADQGIAGKGGRLGTWGTGVVQRKLNDKRIFGTMPGKYLVKNDPLEAVKTFDNALRNAKFTAEERAPYLRRLAETDDVSQMLEITTDFAKDLAIKAMQPSTTALGRVKPGVSEAEANKLVSLYKDKVKADRIFWQDQIGRNRAFGKDKDVVRLANGEIAPQPHLASQMLDSAVPLPDAREVRAAISPYRNLLNNPLVKTPLSVTEKITDNVFKPFALIRPAYMVRNALDEQFRPAGVGLNTMFNHPVQYINWLISDQAGVAKVLQRASRGRVGVGRGMQDVTGTAFDEEREVLRAAEREYEAALKTSDPERVAEAERQRNYAKAALGSRGPLQDGASAYVRSLEGGVGNWRNMTVVEKEGYKLIQRDEPQYAQVLAEALHKIHLDPVAVRVARGGPIPGDSAPAGLTGLDGIKDWYLRGAGQGFRKDLSKANERMKWLEEPAGVSAYVDDTEAFVKDFVGDSQAFREAAATGKINGIELTVGDDLAVNPKAIEEINRLKALGEGLPAVAGKVNLDPAMGFVSGYDRAVEWAFKQLGSRPSDFLARSPIFRQQYYRRMEQLVVHASPEAQAEIIEGAKAAKMQRAYISRLEQVRDKHKNGTLTLFEADEVAKADSLEFTKGLVYDLTTRSQFFDVTRILFPFGEAFANTAKTYSRIAVNNPVVPYRIGQTVLAGRDQRGGWDFNPDENDRGFFYTDEQTGEEVFAWPFAGPIAEQLGINGFKSPLAGLNLIGNSVLPGFGPVVQISASSMLPNDADFNGVRALISPYGDRDLEGGAIESFLPAWINKFRTAELIPFLDGSAEQQRAFAESKKDVMSYLVSTGEYNVATPEAMQELEKAASTRARAIWFLRGMAQAFAPSPPSPEFVAKDRDGKMQLQFTLAERLNELQQEDYETALPRFINEFGVEALMGAMSNTKAADGVSPLSPTKDAYEFLQNNRGAFERHTDVFGLFAPSGGKFDFTAYGVQLEQGQRVPLTPKEHSQRANDQVAKMLFNQAKKMAGEEISDEENARLKQYREELKAKYPGYEPSSGGNADILITKLEFAAKDATLGGTEVGKALNLYLQVREQAEQFSQAKYGTSFKTSDKAKAVRERLRAYATQLGTEYDGFSEMFERAFDREMKDD